MEPKQSAREFDEGKFIVINKKRFTELLPDHIDVVKKFSNALTEFVENYEHLTGKQMNQRYIVCNLDEPYAERVKAIILGTENAPVEIPEDEEGLVMSIMQLPFDAINGKRSGTIGDMKREAAALLTAYSDKIRRECADRACAFLDKYNVVLFADVSNKSMRAAIEGKE